MQHFHGVSSSPNRCRVPFQSASTFVPVPSVSVTICLKAWSLYISTRPEGHRTSMSTGTLRLPNPKVSQGLLVERPEPALTSWTYASVRPRGP